MGICSYLQVDVNGQELFFVDKKILAAFSGKFSGSLTKSMAKTHNLKLIFHGFPGGPQAFELILRFFYNDGGIDITPTNVFLLHCASIFMEIHKTGRPGLPNLETLIHEFIQNDILFWNWSEFLTGLRQCQGLFSYLVSSSSTMIDNFLDCFVRKLISRNINKNLGIELAFLNPELLEKIIKTMISQEFDQETVCLFLFQYQKSKFRDPDLEIRQKFIITETVIDLLDLLDPKFVSFRGIVNIFYSILRLKSNEKIIKKLENIIGSRFDEARLSDLIFPSRRYAYDVDFVLRLVEVFLLEIGIKKSIYRLKKAGVLMDYYITEVAPDRCLKFSKFLALAMALPDLARDSHERMYQAIDMYFEVQSSVGEEEKIKICCALNLEKLSSKTLRKLSLDPKFPPCAAMAALVSLQSNIQILPKPKDEFDQNLIYFGEFDFISRGNEKVKYSHVECMKIEKINMKSRFI